MKWIRLIIVFFIIVTGTPAFADEVATFKSWVQAMKTSPRGPFSRIQWFCKDGSVLPPRPYACQERGGGVQHGEWTFEVKTMREKGYFIATVYADLDPALFMEKSEYLGMLRQMILEQFLINADEGWIFRKARYYRGALQAEDETAKGQKLLEKLLLTHHHSSQRFLLLREAVRLIPHHHQNVPVSQMRQLSLTLAEADKNFNPLRTKIHVRPDLQDADRVRAYAKKSGQMMLTDPYEQLAKIIEAVFQPADLTPFLNNLARQVKGVPLAGKLLDGAERLESQKDPLVRFTIVTGLITALRESFVQVERPEVMLSLADTSILLEDELFRLGAGIVETLPGKTIGQLLGVLEMCSDILYGTGFISDRQHKALKNRVTIALMPGRNLDQFQADLTYFARATAWSEQNLLFHFSRAIDHFYPIEPIARRYVHDRLHSSLLLVYSLVLEMLITDNTRQIGGFNDIWGKPIALGVIGLNPGLARGILREPEPGEDLGKFPRESILILPSTTADLPPVAGIITAGQGNTLSHVQMLARNLGIPNVAVDQALLSQIRTHIGQKGVLAVSPKGLVRLAKDGSQWDKIFAQKAQMPRTILKPDLEKLELTQTGFVSLGDIRASDSGRIAGPKAANLGELKHHFPGSVTEGVVIPFGVFRNLLDLPFDAAGLIEDPELTMFDWMKQQYARINSLQQSPVARQQTIETFLDTTRSWILAADPGAVFTQALKEKLETTLGPDGSYGVFVRSDTNVEDLPGFTGAGLNLTLPHVVGMDNILAAILRVWASPFTLRSFGWRQAYLTTPEHVYASVLLMKTVPVEKSGVMVTRNLATGEGEWLTIAVNEGVGGAVSGQTAEQLQVHIPTGEVTLLSQATEPLKWVVSDAGGMNKKDASGTETLLSPAEISQLIACAAQLPEKFPSLKNDQGGLAAADVEFGFLNNTLVLFQIRPLVDDLETRKNRYLLSLDQQIHGSDQSSEQLLLNLNRVPAQEAP